MGDKTRGLYRKFWVRRTDGSSALGGKHYGCEYFVLDLDHDPHARAALVAYADSCRADYPLLAADLDAKAKAYWGDAARAEGPGDECDCSLSLDGAEGPASRLVDGRTPVVWKCNGCGRLSLDSPYDVQQALKREVDAREAAEARAKEAEEKVAAQQETIRALRVALPSTCDSVHHRKADRHEAGEPCPVLMRAEAVLKEHDA